MKDPHPGGWGPSLPYRDRLFDRYYGMSTFQAPFSFTRRTVCVFIVVEPLFNLTETSALSSVTFVLTTSTLAEAAATCQGRT